MLEYFGNLALLFVLTKFFCWMMGVRVDEVKLFYLVYFTYIILEPEL